MSDLEYRLMRALAQSRQPTDESFVSKVIQAVEANESARTMRLYALTVVALCLVGTLGYGLYLSWNAARVMSMTLATALSTTASVASLALAAIAFLVSRAQSRE
jgi:hypothetical protein